MNAGGQQNKLALIAGHATQHSIAVTQSPILATSSKKPSTLCSPRKTSLVPSIPAVSQIDYAKFLWNKFDNHDN
jgi:hypothetical protein